MKRRRRINYSKVEMKWLEANRMMIVSDYHRAFCARFGRKDVSMANLHGLRKRKGWKVGRAKGRYKGRQEGRYRLYSADEAKWLRENCTLEISKYHRGFCDAFNRTDRSPAQLHALRHRKGWRTGRTGCFPKGHEPANKGKICPEGKGGRHPNARKTQFRKGSLSGRAAEIKKPLGFERLTREGYIERKINNGMPLQARWRAVHVINWEAVNGPIPKGHVLKRLDDNKLNTDASNWKAIPRAVLARLNGGRHKKRLAYDEAPIELKPTIMAAAELHHRAKEAARR